MPESDARSVGTTDTNSCDTQTANTSNMEHRVPTDTNSFGTQTANTSNMEHRVPADTNSFGTQTANMSNMEHRVPTDTYSFGTHRSWSIENQLTLTVLGHRIGQVIHRSWSTKCPMPNDTNRFGAHTNEKLQPICRFENL